MVEAPYIPGEPGRVERPALGYAMVIGAALLFAVNGTVSKVVLQSGISTVELVQFRSAGAFAGFALALLALNRGRLRVSLRELPFLLVYGMGGIAFVQWLYFVSIERLPIGIALLIEYVGVLFVALFARFVYHERVRRRIWLALACALGGLALVVEVWAGFVFDGLGLVAASSCAFVFAAYILLAERGVKHRDPASLSCYGFLFGAIFWSIVRPWWEFPFGRMAADVSLLGRLDSATVPVWLLVTFVVAVGTMATFGLVAAALRHISATRVGIVAMLEPVGAALVAFLWLGETFGVVQLVGGAIVLAGILLAQTAR